MAVKGLSCLYVNTVIPYAKLHSQLDGFHVGPLEKILLNELGKIVIFKALTRYGELCFGYKKLLYSTQTKKVASTTLLVKHRLRLKKKA